MKIRASFLLPYSRFTSSTRFRIDAFNLTKVEKGRGMPCEIIFNAYELINVSYERTLLSYESGTVSYEMTLFSYESGTVSYESGLVSYEMVTFSYESGQSSYERMPFSSRTHAVFI